jgi:hypothetical protein
MARGFSSGDHAMVIWAERDALKYRAKWFCSCGKFFGESSPIYASDDVAMNAAEKHLAHLYTAHPEPKSKDKPLISR